ncbi:proton-conducting transporter transmembrane domain-containing protein [Planctomicrobium piriforme]|uniref:Formate hydrogenlyase subunit 3/Multisubunit Na+/H+ antiporter, MnhD subunit n=1 Tax=Planctomicrobium piriforme TaxID=1576369 RepID=A0A1I3AZF8_9PLAN|nr:proton-conducting transporter membrane subunit [Planctomicrobium piriforme]SFH54791.1 Formate hydrogenlyase subunit 3/Multisubunit Na+/H+ antiporter, MnhD subunit [Planctomicrobium piriforme]
MALPSHVASYALLFQLLCPLLGAVLLAGLSSNRRRFHIAVAIHGLLAVVGGLLWFAVISQALNGTGGGVEVAWPIPSWGTGSSLANRVVWQIDLMTAGFVALLPWVSLTASLFTEPVEARQQQISGNLLLVGALQFFAGGGDIGSCFAGLFASALLISLMIAWYGGEAKRSVAWMFLATQWIGGLLVMGGLGMLIAAASLIRSAPRGVPGDASAAIPELAKILQEAFERHSAARELWGEFRGLPMLFIVVGFLLMSGCFPVHAWLTRSLLAAPLAVRVWIAAWVKGVMLIGLKFISQLDAQTIADLQGWGWTVALLGGLFMAGLLLVQADFGRLLAAAIVWTQAVATISICGATRDFERLLVPLLLSQMAALILLTVALSILPARCRSIELGSYQGLWSRTGWIGPTLLVCLLLLTLTPASAGLFQAWLGFASLQGWEKGWGLAAWVLNILANGVALAGFVRIARQLVTGPLRLPEMSPGLRERVSSPPPEIDLTLSRAQRWLLCVWAFIGLATAFLYPLFLMLPGPLAAAE